MKNAALLLFTVLSIGSARCYAIDFNDGGTHDISWILSGTVTVDQQTPGAFTKVNFLTGGGTTQGFHWVEAHNDARVTLNGGSLGGSLNAHDRSEITVYQGAIGNGGTTAYGTSRVDFFGGTVDGVVSRENSTVNIYDGNIGSWLWASEESNLRFHGGTLNGDLHTQSSARMEIFGSDFRVNGQPVAYGPLISILGMSPEAEPPRRLTGLLSNGDVLDNDFFIGNESSIVLVPVPEPGAALLLQLGWLGGMLLRRNRFSKSSAT